MKTIAITSTEKTPEIIGNSITGMLSITGKSYMVDAETFFAPLYKWLPEFYNTTSNTIAVTIDIEYMNTSTGMILVKMLKELRKLAVTKKVNVVWRYAADDLDMREVGLDFKFFIGEIIELQGKHRLAS